MHEILDRSSRREVRAYLAHAVDDDLANGISRGHDGRRNARVLVRQLVELLLEATIAYTSSHDCLTDRSARRSSGLPSNTMRPCPMT